MSLFSGQYSAALCCRCSYYSIALRNAAWYWVVGTVQQLIVQTLYETQERKVKKINCFDQGRSPVRVNRVARVAVTSGYI
jgi:hypothetical protein